MTGAYVQGEVRRRRLDPESPILCSDRLLGSLRYRGRDPAAAGRQITVSGDGELARGREAARRLA